MTRYCPACKATYLSLTTCPRDGLVLTEAGPDPMLGQVLGDRSSRASSTLQNVMRVNEAEDRDDSVFEARRLTHKETAIRVVKR